MSFQQVLSGPLVHSSYHADAQAQSAAYVEVDSIVCAL